MSAARYESSTGNFRRYDGSRRTVGRGSDSEDDDDEAIWGTAAPEASSSDSDDVVIPQVKDGGFSSLQQSLAAIAARSLEQGGGGKKVNRFMAIAAGKLAVKAAAARAAVKEREAKRSGVVGVGDEEGRNGEVAHKARMKRSRRRVFPELDATSPETGEYMCCVATVLTVHIGVVIAFLALLTLRMDDIDDVVGNDRCMDGDSGDMVPCALDGGIFTLCQGKGGGTVQIPCTSHLSRAPFLTTPALSAVVYIAMLLVWLCSTALRRCQIIYKGRWVAVIKIGAMVVTVLSIFITLATFIVYATHVIDTSEVDVIVPVTSLAVPGSSWQGKQPDITAQALDVCPHSQLELTLHFSSRNGTSSGSGSCLRDISTGLLQHGSSLVSCSAVDAALGTATCCAQLQVGGRYTIGMFNALAALKNMYLAMAASLTLLNVVSVLMTAALVCCRS